MSKIGPAAENCLKPRFSLNRFLQTTTTTAIDFSSFNQIQKLLLTLTFGFDFDFNFDFDFLLCQLSVFYTMFFFWPIRARAQSI